MTNDRIEPLSQRLRRSISRHRRSVLAFVAVGVLLAAVVGIMQVRSTTVVVDVGASPDYQLVQGLGLAPAVEPAYAPANEEYVINHLYPQVSAESIGDLVSISTSASDADLAMQQIEEFLDDYLALRNDSALAVFEQSRDAASARASMLQSTIDEISAALQDPSVDASSRTGLEVQQAEVAIALAEAQNEANGYRTLAEGRGPIVIVQEPRVLDISLATKLLPAALILFLLTAIGVAQAFWRDSEADVAADE